MTRLLNTTPRQYYEMNTEASIALVKMCKEQGVQRYLYASSCSVYDRGVASEEGDVVLDESADVSLQAAYSSSKFVAEKELFPLGSNALCVTVLRKGTLFGFSPRMRYDLVVNTFVKDALTK